MTRVVLPCLLLLAACAAPTPPTRTADQQRQDAAEEACRQEATRTVLYRDRGQTMRIDEGQSRVGVQASIPTVRAETDRLGQQFERDRIMRECIRARTAGPAPTDRAPAPSTRRGS